MQDRFKFRVVYYNDVEKKYFIFEPDLISADGTARAYAYGESGADEYYDTVTLNQSTGLKDKNGLNLLFECDIINTEGIKIGNCYENEYLLKDTTNFVIKGMGTKEWRNSEQEAIKRGCYYAE